MNPNNIADTLNEDGTGGICGYPYAVSSKPGVGRCLVATRDLDPGDLILKGTLLTMSKPKNEDFSKKLTSRLLLQSGLFLEMIRCV